MSENREGSTRIEKKVDEAWKEQVEREKAQTATVSKPEPRPDPGPAARKERPAGSKPEHKEKSDAAFAQFVTGLAMQAMAAMGEISDPRLGSGRVNIDEARAFIDLLGVLQEKTRGNLTEEEAGMLESYLYELRMKFVEKKGGA